MSEIVLPRRFKGQPQFPAPIDRTNPITRGIKCAGNLTAKAPVDSLGNPITYYGTVDKIAASTGGVGLYSDLSNDYHGLSLPLWANVTGEASLVVRQKRETTSANVWLEFSTVDNNAQDHFTYGGLVYTDAFWSSRWIDGGGLPSGVSETNDHVIVFTVKDGEQKAYWNGQLWRTNTLTGGFTLPSTGYFGNANRNFIPGFGGWLYQYLLYDRVLPATEAISISQNIHQAWQAPARRLWAVSAGGAAAALAGDAQSVASATGGLSTKIALAGAPQSQASASGALTAQIALAGNPLSVATANGSLTAQIKLSGAALAQAISTAALSTGINLSAASVATAAASGMLDTVIKLIATAQAGASASGDLSTGGAGALSVNAQSSATATGNLTAQVRLNAAALAQAAAAAGLSTGINLAAGAQNSPSASGDLTASIKLTAAAVSRAIAAGGITTQIKLSASAVASASASGTLPASAVLLPPPAWRTLSIPQELRVLSVEFENRTLSA